jgi:dTDP-4-dehydrorhamnose reductase
MKVAVFGSNGMAGHMVVRYLRDKGHSVTTLARSNADMIVDVENTNSVYSVIAKLHDYDYVINCVGLLVKDSIDRPDRAAVINAWFPHALEHHYRLTNTKIIHLSTDCVFDGQTGHYSEKDVHTEMNAYGRSKSLGELNNTKDITFRMSIIGPEIKNNGTGLLHWTLNNKADTLGGYVDAWWNGITTLQLAKCIEQYMQDPTITGVYHLVNNEYFVNKYELLCLINQVYELNKIIKKTTGPKLANKVLIDSRLEIDFQIPDHKTQLRELRSYG